MAFFCTAIKRLWSVWFRFLPWFTIPSVSFACLRIIPSVLNIAGIPVTFMFHSFFNSLAKFPVFVNPFAFFDFHDVVRWNSKFPQMTSSFVSCWLTQNLFCFFLFFCGGLGDPFVSQNPREFYVSFSRTDTG